MIRARQGSPAGLVLWGCALALAGSFLETGCGWFDTQPAPGPVDAGVAGAGGSDGGSGDSGVAGNTGADGGAVCGDGIVSGNEECDNGPSNGPGSGCETDCRFSCHIGSDCDDGNPCSGVETCHAVVGGRACKAGTPAPDGSACGTSGHCKSGKCIQPTCGNGVVDAGEDCEPPNTATCDANCKKIVCGDGVIAGNEQCDDGNTRNLDGCDSNCRYETVMRYATFNFSRDPAPAYCVHNGNALGAAFSDYVISQYDNNTKTTIDGGGFNGFLVLDGLDDLTGANAASIRLGSIAGTIDTNYPDTWDPNAIDEWYLADATGLDSQDQPTQFFSPAAITSHLLSGGPSPIKITFVTNLTAHVLDSFDASIRATIDTSPAPDVPKAPPSALAPGLKVFQTITATAKDQGICGVVTVDALAHTQLPQDFCLGPNACQDSSVCSGSRTYSCSTNSLLDAIVGGCKSTSLCVPLVTATQPDVGTGGNPPATLTNGANNVVTPSVPSDGYTYFIHFTAARAHLTNNLQ